MLSPQPSWATVQGQGRVRTKLPKEEEVVWKAKAFLTGLKLQSQIFYFSRGGGVFISISPKPLIRAT